MPRPNLFSTEFWRAYWIAILRSRRDRRDMKAALTVTIGLLFFVVYYGYLLWTARKVLNAGAISILSVLLAMLFGMMILTRISNKRDERDAARDAESDVDQDVRRRLATDALIILVLIARAGSEQAIKQKKVPTEANIITRSKQIELLRQLGKWDELSGQVRNLLMLPDSGWSELQIASIRPCFETLRCLRWILCLDGELEKLTRFPKMDYSAALQSTDQSAELIQGKRMLAVWDIRVQRNATDAIFSRLFAEAIGRGLAKAPTDEANDWAAKVNSAMRDPHTGDLLAGIRTVSELDNPSLMYLLSVSFHRHRCLQLLMNLIDNREKWQSWHAFCFPDSPI